MGDQRCLELRASRVGVSAVTARVTVLRLTIEVCEQ